MKSVSVIMPLYNQGHFLKDSISSLVNQTHKDWEAIIINDGSVDNSGDIADELAASESRIKVIHQKNAGVAAARNAGLQVAKGDYVALLDSDDCYLADFLTKMLGQFDFQADTDLVWSQPQITDYLLKPIAPFLRGVPGVACRSSQYTLAHAPARRLLWNNPSVPCGELWKARAIKKLMFSEERELSSNEDWDLLCRLEQAGGKFSFLEGNFSYYRKHGSSANANMSKMISSFIYCANKNYTHSNDDSLAHLASLSLVLNTSSLKDGDSLLSLIPGNSMNDADAINLLMDGSKINEFAILACMGAIKRIKKESNTRARIAVDLLSKKLLFHKTSWAIFIHRLSEHVRDKLNQA